MNITNIPAPRVAFIDERTGLMSREWYRFFLNLFTLTGGGTTDVSLADLQIQPVEYAPSIENQIADMAARSQQVADAIEAIRNSIELAVISAAPVSDTLVNRSGDRMNGKLVIDVRSGDILDLKSAGNSVAKTDYAYDGGILAGRVTVDYSGMPDTLQVVTYEVSGADSYFEFLGHLYASGTFYPGTGTTTQAPIHFEDGVLKTTPVAGDLEYSDGHFYITNGARHAIVSSSGVKTSTTTVVNTAVETEIYTYTLVGSELHADHRIILSVDGVYSNASGADDWTMRLKFNGATVRTLSRTGGNVTDSGWKLEWYGTIRTEGVSGTFVDHAILNDGTATFSAGTVTAAAIDTTVSNTVSVTIQWANAKAGNTFSCTSGDLTFKH